MKNKMKKTLAMLLSFVMVFAMLPVGAFDVAAATGDGQSEETARQVSTAEELALALMSNGITYIRITQEIDYTIKATEQSMGLFYVAGTKVLLGDYPVTVSVSGEGAQIRSMFYLDDPTDSLTLHNVGTYTFKSNHMADGAVVFVEDGTFNLEGSKLRGEVIDGLNAGCHAVYVDGGTVNLRSGDLYGTAQGCTVFWGVLYVCGGTTTLGGTFSPLTIGGYADPNYKYYNTCAGVAVYGGAHQALTIGGNVTINKVRDHSIRTYTTSHQKISSIIDSGCSLYPSTGTLASQQPIGTNTEAITESVRVIKPVTNAAFRLDGYRLDVNTGADGIIDMESEDMSVSVVGGQVKVDDIYVSPSEDVNETKHYENTTLQDGKDYWLIVQFSPIDGYDASFLNSNLISLIGVTATQQAYEYDSRAGCCYAKFKLPQLEKYTVEDFVFSLGGYELGASIADITVAAEGDTKNSVVLWDTNGVFIADTIPSDPDDTQPITGTFAADKDYYLVVTFDPKPGNIISEVNEENSHLIGIAATVQEAYCKFGYGTVIFKLPKIPEAPVTSLNFTISGYGLGKTTEDIQITEADGEGKVTIQDNFVISTSSSEANAISPSLQLPQNQDLWLIFTITAADGLTVSGITDSLISFSGVKVTEKPTVVYNSTFEYMTVSLKLPQINTTNAVPNVWVDVTGYEYGKPIADLGATINAECDDYVELYLVGIYSDESCDSATEITVGDFEAETDYWLEVIVVSKGSYHLEYTTDAITRLNGVNYTDMNAAYDKFADFFYVRVKLNHLSIPEVTVTFNANGHGTDPEAQRVIVGQNATAPTAPAATGYTFGGWYTDAECTVAYDFDTAVTADVTLYAKWTENAPEDTTEAETEPATEDTTEAETEPATEDTTEAETEPATEDTTEAETEPATEDTTEAETEPATEDTTEAETEPATEDTTEPATEDTTEATTEPATEDTTEPATEPAETPTETPTEEPTTEAPEASITESTEATTNEPTEAPATELTTEPVTDPVTDNSNDPDDDKDDLGAGAIVAIIIGSTAVVGGGGFALVWFVIKKKTWAEFLAIFKKG